MPYLPKITKIWLAKLRRYLGSAGDDERKSRLWPLSGIICAVVQPCQKLGEKACAKACEKAGAKAGAKAGSESGDRRSEAQARHAGNTGSGLWPRRARHADDAHVFGILRRRAGITAAGRHHRRALAQQKHPRPVRPEPKPEPEAGTHGTPGQRISRCVLRFSCAEVHASPPSAAPIP